MCSYLCGMAVAAAATVFMLLFAPEVVRLLTGSSESIVIENGALYMRVVSPCLALLGILNSTRMGLQAVGKKILPLLSSVIELAGKILFVVFFIPRFQYMAVIFCEPVIWCFMVAELLIAFWSDSFVRSKEDGKGAWQ